MCCGQLPLAWLEVTTTQELIDVVFHHLSQARLGKGAANSEHEGDSATVHGRIVKDRNVPESRVLALILVPDPLRRTTALPANASRLEFSHLREQRSAAAKLDKPYLIHDWCFGDCSQRPQCKVSGECDPGTSG